MKRLLIALPLGLFACAQALGALPPPHVDPALKTLPNWKAEILAQSPDVNWPSAVEQAPDGRIFIGEHAEDMPGPAGAPIDRILCIFPDGHVTVFAEHLNAVFALRYIDGKLLVHQSPTLTLFTDDNGVGKDPHNLIESTYRRPPGNALNDHIPAEIRLAMDNHLYLSTGDKGVFGAVSNADRSTAQIHGGGIVRMYPDASNLEVYSTGTRNHLDLALTDEDEIFTYDNTDDGQGWWTRYTHMIDGGYYGYPFDYKVPGKPETYGHNGEPRDPTRPFQPWTLWRMDEFGGGSPCGAVGYNEGVLPAEYSANNFHCEWGKGAFERFAVAREGGSFRILKHEQILKGPNFRPLATTALVDGTGFLIADWEYGGWSVNKPQGRLIRLTYTGALTPAPRPDWYLPAAMGQKFEASIPELIAALSHPSESVRLVVQRRLSERGQPAVVPLIALMKDPSKPAYARWHAVWTLDRMDGGEAAREDIVAVAKDPMTEASVRRQAIRQLGTRAAKESGAALAPLLADPDVTIRFAATTALGRIGDAATVPALLGRLTEKDFYTHYATFVALRRIGLADRAAWPAIVKGLYATDPAVRAGVVLAAHETFDSALVDALAAVAADKSASGDARTAAVLALAPLHRQQPAWDGRWWGTQPAGSLPPAKTVDWNGTSLVLNTLRSALTDSNVQVRSAAIAALEDTPDPQAVGVLASMFGQETDAGLRGAILRALAASKSPVALDTAAGLLKQPGVNEPLIPDALAVIEAVNTPQAAEVLIAYIESTPHDPLPAFAALERMKPAGIVPAVSKQVKSNEESIAVAATGLLGKLDDPAAAQTLIPALTDTRESVRRAAAAALGRMQFHDAVPALLDAYAKDPAIHGDAIDALARMPDVRAVNAYIDGLAGQDAGVRDESRKALRTLGQAGMPAVEARLDASPPIPGAVVAELQTIYAGARPIMHWRIIGPFPRKGPDAAPIDQLPSQKELHGLNGKTVTWQEATGDMQHGLVDLRKLIQPSDEVSAYAVGEFNSPADRDVQIVGGSDDGMSLWLNGAQLLSDESDHAYDPEHYRVTGHARAGVNVIVVRVGQAGGGWEFSVSASGNREGKLFTYDASANSPRAYAAFALAHEGDPAAGSAIFHNAQGVGCIKCHTVGAEGGAVGPNLSDVAVKYPKEHLIDDVLTPSKQIESGYEQTLVRTKNGNVEAGIVRGETDEEITLFDSTAKKIVIRKSDIQSRKASPVSVMPEGLQAGLTQQQFADLIAYLTTLRQKPDAR